MREQQGAPLSQIKESIVIYSSAASEALFKRASWRFVSDKPLRNALKVVHCSFLFNIYLNAMFLPDSRSSGGFSSGDAIVGAILKQRANYKGACTKAAHFTNKSST